MISRMAACSISMLDEWKRQAIEFEAMDKLKTIEISKEFQKLTADIIAHTAFGSSFVQGNEAFEAQRQLQKHCVASTVKPFIPGSQYLFLLSISFLLFEFLGFCAIYSMPSFFVLFLNADIFLLSQIFRYGS